MPNARVFRCSGSGLRTESPKIQLRFLIPMKQKLRDEIEKEDRLKAGLRTTADSRP
jgi:hypothetical protein